MRKNLLEFLFGPTAVGESSQNLGEDVVRLFEEAADEETEQMVADKKPLAAALKAIGVSASVEDGPSLCTVRADNEADYREMCGALNQPDNIHQLAELGWVVAKCGDAGMGNEAPDYRINFIELTNVATGDSDKAPDLDNILKDAQKFAATKMDRDDEMNPVENDDKTSSNHRKGVGKEADGAKPEGKPKGASESASRRVSAKTLADSLLSEMTGCASIPAVDGAPLGVAGQATSARNRFRSRKNQKADVARKPNR